MPRSRCVRYEKERSVTCSSVFERSPNWSSSSNPTLTYLGFRVWDFRGGGPLSEKVSKYPVFFLIPVQVSLRILIFTNLFRVWKFREGSPLWLFLGEEGNLWLFRVCCCFASRCCLCRWTYMNKSPVLAWKTTTPMMTKSVHLEKSLELFMKRTWKVWGVNNNNKNILLCYPGTYVSILE